MQKHWNRTQHSWPINQLAVLHASVQTIRITIMSIRYHWNLLQQANITLFAIGPGCRLAAGKYGWYPIKPLTDLKASNMAKAEGRAYTSVYGLWQSASGQSDYGDGQSFFAHKDNDHWCEKPFCRHKSGEVWVNELCPAEYINRRGLGCQRKS